MKEYLLYLLGELTEYRSEKYPDNRFWKNDEYGIVLELEKSGKLWVYYKIWESFSKFFSSEYDDTQKVMKSVLEEHLKLVVKTPTQFVIPYSIALEEHLKLVVITPLRKRASDLQGLEEHLKLVVKTPPVSKALFFPRLEEHLKLVVITPYLCGAADSTCWKDL